MVIAIASARLLVETIEQELMGNRAAGTSEGSSLHAVEESTRMADAVVHDFLLPYLHHLLCPSTLVGIGCLPEIRES